MIIAFVCVHNSCRSQMAEGWFKYLKGDRAIEVYSAGTENYPEVKPKALQVMKAKGIDMSKHQPKLLSDIPDTLDILVTMGCNVVCPFVPNSHSEDWALEDPSGGTIEAFEKTRDLIKDKVLNLIKRIDSGAL